MDKVIRNISFFIMFIAIIENSWLIEDALISFRVVDNFVNGYGLRWNIDERVQVYTNPLWLLIHIPFYYFFNNIYFITIIISIIVSSVAILYTTKIVRNASGIQILNFVILPLLLTNSFREFTSSGLENPLTFLLTAYFIYILLNYKNNNIPWLKLTLVLSLMLMNRLDSIIAFIPIFTYLFISNFSLRVLKLCLLGAIPFILWELFSLWYYGFLLPNTKYAKISSSVDNLWYINNGIIYLKDLFAHDNVGFIILFSGLVTSVYNIVRRKYCIKIRMLGFGLFLSVVYVISVGGDYISGRFWSLPILLSVIINYISWNNSNSILLKSKQKKIFINLISILLLISFLATEYNSEKFDLYTTIGVALDSKVVNEREIYASTSALFYWPEMRINLHGETNWFVIVLMLTGKWPPLDKTSIVIPIGSMGFNAGNKYTFIDVFGIADALIARLPVIAYEKTGHLIRNIPYGYIEYRKTGSMAKLDKNLAKYLQKLSIITSGDLYSWKRLKVIILFNLGEYDHYLDKYIKSKQGVAIVK